MILPWVVAAAALAVALLAWVRTRRLAQRLDQLLQMYWELKYQHGELRVQLQRALGDAPPAVPQPPAERPTDGFIPLSSLKR
jgi:hypothetical protein